VKGTATVAKKAVVKDAVTEDDQAKDAVTEDDQAKDAVTEDDQAKDAVTEDDQAKDAVTEDDQAEDDQAEDDQAEYDQAEYDQAEYDQAEYDQAEYDQAELTSDCHEMLLRLAGRLPDELMTRCREQLAQGTFGDMARAVVFSVLSQDLPLASYDVATLTALLAETGGEVSALDDVEIDESDPMIWHFADDLATAVDAVGDQGEVQDASTTSRELEQAMVEGLAGEPEVIGCWRAWRLPSDDPPSAPAKAVFTVEASADANLAGTAARAQQWLAAAGEPSPQVEVYNWDAELPVYQRLARGYGQLIWAAAPDPGMQIAAVFDEVDPQDGPRFSPDHPRLEEDEAARVAHYLREAEPVLVTTARMDDVVDTTRQYCVPLNFRTDGIWIWTEACAYYAQEHRLEPDPELLAHIRSNNHTVPEVDGVALHRALEVLQSPPEDEPVWTFGESSGQQASDDMYDDYDYDDYDDDQPAPGQDESESAEGQDGSQAAADDVGTTPGG
jgi:hypothetical protein